jgi:hypothetical protein
MQRERATDAQIDAVHHYLEHEFPGQVNNTWWDAHTQEPVFEIAHGSVRHEVEVTSTFLEHCPDCTDGLQNSELGDYMREARAHDRRFLVLWQGREARIRSKQL